MKHIKLFEAFNEEDIKSCFQTLIDEYGFEYLYRDYELFPTGWKDLHYYAHRILVYDLKYDKVLLESVSNDLVTCIRKLQAFGMSKIELEIDFKYDLYKPTIAPGDSNEWVDGNDVTLEISDDFTDLHNIICKKILTLIHGTNYNRVEGVNYVSEISISRILLKCV